MEGIRYANISLAIMGLIMVISVILFRHAGKSVLQGIFIATVILGAAIYFGLEERAKRRRGRDQ